MKYVVVINHNMEKNSEEKEDYGTEEDPITGVIGDSGKYQLLMCLLIAFFEVHWYILQLYWYTIPIILSFPYKNEIVDFSYLMLGAWLVKNSQHRK